VYKLCGKSDTDSLSSTIPARTSYETDVRTPTRSVLLAGHHHPCISHTRDLSWILVRCVVHCCSVHLLVLCHQDVSPTSSVLVHRCPCDRWMLWRNLAVASRLLGLDHIPPLVVCVLTLRRWLFPPLRVVDSPRMPATSTGAPCVRRGRQRSA
jgi:hypothetical protein